MKSHHSRHCVEVHLLGSTAASVLECTFYSRHFSADFPQRCPAKCVGAWSFSGSNASAAFESLYVKWASQQATFEQHPMQYHRCICLRVYAPNEGFHSLHHSYAATTNIDTAICTRRWTKLVHHDISSRARVHSAARSERPGFCCTARADTTHSPRHSKSPRSSSDSF